MAAIQILSADKKQNKRTAASFDRSLASTQGFTMLISATSTPDIQDVIDAAGLITLPNTYVQGRYHLRVFVDGVFTPRVAAGYTETSTSSITLAGAIVGALNAVTSVIFIEWGKFLPGIRDQALENLSDVTPDVSAAVRDIGVLRAAATAANPMLTISDVSPGLVTVMNTGQRFLGTFTDGVGGATDFSDNVDFSSLGSPPVPPANATHAIVSGILDSDGSAAQGDWNLYVGAYNGTPAALIDNENLVTKLSMNTASEINATSTGQIYVELNDPVDPTGDLTFIVEKVTLEGTAIVRLFLEAWLVTVP